MKNCALLLPLTLLIIAATAQCSHGEMRSLNKVRVGTPPRDVVSAVVKTNAAHVGKKLPDNDQFAPKLCWVTDVDPNLQAALLMEAQEGNVYTIKNFGAQILESLGPLDYGIRYLHCPVLLITLNSDNKAIHLFLEGYQELPLSIKTNLDHLSPALRSVKKSKNSQEWYARNIEAAVDYQVAIAVERYKDRIDNGRLAVIGSVIDFENNYRRGRNRLIITNINGETEAGKLASMKMTSGMTENLRKVVFGRYEPPPAKKDGDQ